MQRKHVVLVAASLAVGLALTGWIGCGESQAKPLEVTYYYLPG